MIRIFPLVLLYKVLQSDIKLTFLPEFLKLFSSTPSHMLEVGSCRSPRGPIPMVRQITVGGEGLPRETGAPVRCSEQGL